MIVLQQSNRRRATPPAVMWKMRILKALQRHLSNNVGQRRVSSDVEERCFSSLP